MVTTDSSPHSTRVLWRHRDIRTVANLTRWAAEVSDRLRGIAALLAGNQNLTADSDKSSDADDGIGCGAWPAAYLRPEASSLIGKAGFPIGCVPHTDHL